MGNTGTLLDNATSLIEVLLSLLNKPEQLLLERDYKKHTDFLDFFLNRRDIDADYAEIDPVTGEIKVSRPRNEIAFMDLNDRLALTGMLTEDIKVDGTKI